MRTGDPTPGESVAFLVDHYATVFVWNLIALIVFSVALVPLALALHERIKPGSPGMAMTATAFGLIWAGQLIAAGMIINIGAGAIVDLHDTDPDRAESLWLAIDSVVNGLSGGMEIVGPVWVLLVSSTGIRTGALPRGLNYLGILIAIGGLATVVPALETVGIVFGLGLILWLAWLGIVMSRETTDQAIAG